jgi:hypothetical protein
VRSALRHRAQRRACYVAALLVVALTSLAPVGCGAAATDKNEPNDELNAATQLDAGATLEGVIGADDSDVFACDAPDGGATSAFTVTVRTETPQDVQVQVGASIPGAWEGITWPGWKAVTLEDRIEVVGELRKGTVLMFLTGATGTEYAIDITWK